MFWKHKALGIREGVEVPHFSAPMVQNGFSRFHRMICLSPEFQECSAVPGLLCRATWNWLPQLQTWHTDIVRIYSGD